jgi:hypothetical protein
MHDMTSEACLEAAYAKFMRTKKGTPEHDEAGNELIYVLWDATPMYGGIWEDDKKCH